MDANSEVRFGEEVDAQTLALKATCHPYSEREWVTFPNVEVFVCDFLANPRSPEAKKLEEGYEDRGVSNSKARVIAWHEVFDLRDKPDVKEFLFLYGENFEVDIHETRLLRYARPTIEALLRVGKSLLVRDKQTGKFSAARLFSDRLQDKIVVDELNIFMMEEGNVIFSYHD